MEICCHNCKHLFPTVDKSVDCEVGNNGQGFPFQAEPEIKDCFEGAITMSHYTTDKYRQVCARYEDVEDRLNILFAIERDEDEEYELSELLKESEQLDSLIYKMQDTQNIISSITILFKLFPILNIGKDHKTIV